MGWRTQIGVGDLSLGLEISRMVGLEKLEQGSVIQRKGGELRVHDRA